MKPAGYLTTHGTGEDTFFEGDSGQFYNYVLDNTGLWIAASNPLMSAFIRISNAEVRGLGKLEVNPLKLWHGKVPGGLFELALNVFAADAKKERYLAIVWKDGRYSLITTNQKREPGNVEYETAENTVVDLHSHCGMSARFSSTDNNDEKGLRIYGVVGGLGERPGFRLRLGVYGYYQPLCWEDVFTGSPGIFIDKEVEACAEVT